MGLFQSRSYISTKLPPRQRLQQAPAAPALDALARAMPNAPMEIVEIEDSQFQNM